MEPPAEPKPSTSNAAPTKAAAKAGGSKVPAFIGVTVLMALISGGVWTKRSADERNARVVAIRQQVEGKAASWDSYRTRFASTKWRGEKVHAYAEAQTTEPLKTWARERAKLFDTFAEQLAKSYEERGFAAARAKVEQLAVQGEMEQAQALIAQLPTAQFPSAERVLALQQQAYLAPLAALSRQNPQTYKAFAQQEPEAAKADLENLKKEMAAASEGEVMTPQQMFGLELLSAVLPEGDPAAAEWVAMSTAADYFESPDGATLQQWRQAQRAIRAQDWPSAVKHMQSIRRTTVRTRQPFRSAYGWALIKNRPDQPAEAYPFLQEAAAAGDAAARRWVANQDLKEERYPQALRGLEAAVMEGDEEAVPPLLQLYAMSPDVAPRDEAREGGVLQKIVAGPDAPAQAALMLGQLHESGRGFPASAKKALDYYGEAARKGSVPAYLELARCYQKGVGGPADPDQAFDWASRAYATGEREKSIPIIQELMQTAPDRVAKGVQEMFERETVGVGGGYTEKRGESPGVAQLKMNLGKYLDQKGKLGQAAKYYAQSGNKDPAIAKRFAELTASHPCETCGGVGKVQDTIPCPTCGGKGDLTCGHCDGFGKIQVPGAPPCTACGGNGKIVQNGRVVTCPTCEGTGKGKDSVTKKDCTFCVRGRIACTACGSSGRIKIMKECPDCRGKGTRALADRE